MVEVRTTTKGSPMKKNYTEIRHTDVKVGDTLYLVDPDHVVPFKTDPFKVTSVYGWLVGVKGFEDEMDLGALQIFRKD